MRIQNHFQRWENGALSQLFWQQNHALQLQVLALHNQIY